MQHPRTDRRAAKPTRSFSEIEQRVGPIRYCPDCETDRTTRHGVDMLRCSACKAEIEQLDGEQA